MQTILSAEQIHNFYHDHFVEDQVLNFISMLGTAGEIKNVVDIGGGCGFFAKRLQNRTDYKVKVLDMDPLSVQACRESGIDAVQGDALNPKITGDEEIVSFNLILHHLVATSDCDTLALQRRALRLWQPHIKAIFVNEYIYESYLLGFSGWLIYRITKSPLLSWIGSAVANVLPSLRANTFGVGVRFRASQEWLRVFESAGYVVKSTTKGDCEYVSLPRRLLLIKQIRRDSFLLEPQKPK